MGQLRITGGRLARRRLSLPPAAATGRLRPTSDRVREALFSALGGALDGAFVVDLFAGSGALGIEALSRGARGAVFVERDPGSARALRRTLDELGLEDVAEVHATDARRYLATAAAGGVDVVFVDPPYALDLDASWTGPLRALLADEGIVVFERDRRSEDVVVANTHVVFDRAYGDTRVVFAQAGFAEGAGEGSA